MIDLQGYGILFLVCLFSIIAVRAIISTVRTPSRLPPSPIPLPIVRHLHILRPFPHLAIYKLSNRYGPLLHLLIGSDPSIIASSPETASEILKTHDLAFSSRS
uniref:Uncharacterized protein n=1 Tax=Nelumbo nucifera TaxID=4432 RepID=A0A822ZCK1_NELNU|nr:TPA_asm: hypothetical protein HUJ06_000492 [Nelumbo nucifera]